MNKYSEKPFHIFTIATGVYINYLNNFMKSMEFFFPGQHKVVHVFTDNVTVVPNMDGEVTVEATEILDMPYPIIQMMKTYIMKKYVTDDMDYIFYFDIDTLFLNKDDLFWGKIMNLIDGKILMSIHPNYDSRPDLLYVLKETDERSCAYIPEDNEPETRAISSFWCGRHDDIIKMCDYVNSMEKQDIVSFRHLSWFVDENYINKLITMCDNGEITDLKFEHDEHLIATTWHFYNLETPFIFLMQKYDTKIKETKKDPKGIE